MSLSKGGRTTVSRNGKDFWQSLKKLAGDHMVLSWLVLLLPVDSIKSSWLEACKTQANKAESPADELRP
jgi:hypothetical protein